MIVRAFLRGAGPVAAFVLLALVPTAHHAVARPATDVCQITGDMTWAAADSPFRTTCAVAVPAGVTLTIEPGVTVQLGALHNINVAGRLMAVGTQESPIVFSAGAAQPWGSVQLLAGSGPSEIAFARFSGGGARRVEMVGIATDQALVRDSEFGKGAGVAVEIRSASPTVRSSRFVEAVGTGADPAAALRILGASDPIIADNYFQSNAQEGIGMEMNASPRFSGNRFLYNAFDGVLVYGNATRAVRWPSLGPRGWAYQITRTQIMVERGGSLTIAAGATVKFAAGTGMRVDGTLQVRGEAGRPVLFSTNVAVPKPGSWREVRLAPESTDYDEPSGQGSIVEHAVFEYGGSQPNGQLWVQQASPWVANVLFRQSGQNGMAVTDAGARPQLLGLTFVDNTSETGGAGLLVTGGAEPSVLWSTFRNNREGIRVENGANPRVGPHNRFEANLTYALYNDDREVCVDATGNDWGAPSGPLDASARSDACGQGRNDGQGGMVSDHVKYSPWEGQLLPRPTITGPQCGLAPSATPTITGYAPPGSNVQVYDDDTLLGSTTAGSGDTEAPWSFTPSSPLAKGSHVLRARANVGSDGSAPSDPLPLMIDPDQVIQPGGVDVTYNLDGAQYTQPYQDAAGCLTISGDGDWPIRPLSGATLTLRLPVSCPGGATATGAAMYNGADYPFTRLPDGRMAATFDQGQGGTVGVHVVCGATASDLLLGIVSPEFDGFVYDGGKTLLDRIVGAKVTLYVQDRASRQWVPWNGAAYHGQPNPIVTGIAGRFAFYPQPGLYRVRVEAQDFATQYGPAKEVTVGPYVANIGLEGQPPLLRLFLPALRRAQ
jgi:hypothetical protein